MGMEIELFSSKVCLRNSIEKVSFFYHKCVRTKTIALICKSTATSFFVKSKNLKLMTFYNKGKVDEGNVDTSSFVESSS